ncbi:MAG: hypothetical protein JNK85_06910 [Verrucomicrobiales bacterium]|nr:hypothetical protein [Verrucomicrobiales bacterium]
MPYPLSQRDEDYLRESQANPVRPVALRQGDASLVHRLKGVPRSWTTIPSLNVAFLSRNSGQ